MSSRQSFPARPYRGKRRPRNAGPETAADLLPQVVARLGGEDRAIEQRVSLAWPAAVGAVLNRRTRPEAVRGKTLIVRVDSSAFAHELTLLKGEILQRLQDSLGAGLLDDLRTRIGPLGEAQPPVPSSAARRPRT